MKKEKKKKTSGALRNIQCGELDEKTNLQFKVRLLWGVGFADKHHTKLHHLRIKKSTITVDGKSIGKGLFEVTTHDPEQIIFQNGAHIVDYVGESIAEHEREQRMGMAQGLIALYKRRSASCTC